MESFARIIRAWIWREANLVELRHKGFELAALARLHVSHR